ncbi:MAG TPA: ABC transporter permease [Magnetospirillum sp.]|nr:ABC transporter permease [Magnetospirillum sp.]
MLAFLAAPFAVLAARRALLISTTWVEVRRRYAGSLMGAAWVLMGPALLMALYAVIYGAVLRVRPPDFAPADYLLYVFCGLIPFLAFGEALQLGATSLSANKELLLNTVFPADLVPVRAVLIAMVPAVVGLALVLAGDAAFSHWSWHALLVPVVLVFQAAFTMGVVWVLSLANLVVRDIQQMLTYANMVLLIITPIAYTPSMLPEALKPLMYLNPLAYFVISIQHLVLMNQMPPTWIVLVGGLSSLAVFFLGHWMFRRAKLVFFDYA